MASTNDQQPVNTLNAALLFAGPFVTANPPEGLSFSEIAEAWGDAAGKPTALMLQALVQGFWRGKFETAEGTSVFYLIAPDLPPTTVTDDWNPPGMYGT